MLSQILMGCFCFVFVCVCVCVSAGTGDLISLDMGGAFNDPAGDVACR